MSDYNNNLHEAYLSVYKSDQELALDYLVSEGYAETSEEALEIYEQLEDGVIEGILDEVRGCGGKVDPENGKYGNGDSSGMMMSPKKKAETMARRARMEAPSSGPGRSRHMARADRMDRVAKSMKEESEDLGEGFKKMDHRKIAKQVNRLKASGKEDRASTLDIVSRKLDTPEERTFSTRTSRKNKKGGSERQKGMHLRAKSDALADIKQHGLREELDTYDLVLEYLLDEGFADTEDSALQIMSNMSEEWRESIVDIFMNEELTGERARRAAKKDTQYAVKGKRKERESLHRLLKPSEDRTSFGRGNKAMRRMGLNPTGRDSFFNPFN